MEIALGLIGLLLGATLLALSIRETTKVNAGRRIPYWTNAKPTPRRAFVLRALGVMVNMLGVLSIAAATGYWAAILVLVAFVPGALLMVRHNRAVAEHTA